jgi:hypothetical protein
MKTSTLTREQPEGGFHSTVTNAQHAILISLPSLSPPLLQDAKIYFVNSNYDFYLQRTFLYSRREEEIH